MSKFITLLFVLHLTVTVQAQNNSALQTDATALNFILMGDWGRNGADHQKEVAAQMAKTASQGSIDFIVSAGDNFYPSGVASEFDPLWRFSFEEIYTDFSLQWDWYPVLGNHDYGSNPEAQVRYSTISRRWRMPARYYSKTMNLSGDTTQQVLFLFIDTTPLIRNYYKGEGHNVNDQDSSAQKLWIEKQLSTTSENIRWKFVVGHHPMYTGGSRTESHDTRSIRRILQPLLKKYDVDAYFAGHEHSLQHIVHPDGVQHFISGASSEVTPVKMLQTSRFAQSTYGFMVFSVSAAKTLVQVVDHEGNVIYRTELIK